MSAPGTLVGAEVGGEVYMYRSSVNESMYTYIITVGVYVDVHGNKRPVDTPPFDKKNM